MLEIGTILEDRYEIINPIGQGGMGAVYMARDRRLGNTVALKETFFSETALLQAFEREARLLAGLRHAALPKVIDHFANNQGQFLVMEYIPGDDLHDLLEETGPVSLNEALQWADQLLDALDYLHSQDPAIIHRDIKPQNLKLTSRNQIILLDFGLAKGTSAEMSRSNSNSSIFGYTPCYAPLEQVQGSGTDSRSDLYSLAATLYHLLTGAKPADVLTRASSILNNQPDPLTPASQVNSRVPVSVSIVLTQAMALNKNQRMPSAARMREMLYDCSRTVGNSPEVKKNEAGKAQSPFLRTEIKASDNQDATPNASTNIFASPQATPARSPQSSSGYTTRASSTNVKREIPARLQERSPRRPAPGTAARQNVRTVGMASEGLSNFPKIIAAGVVLIAVVAVTLFAFTRGAYRDEANAAPVTVQKNEAATGTEQSEDSAKKTVEPYKESDYNTQPTAPSNSSADSQQLPAADDPADNQQETETSQQTASREEAAQNRTPTMQEPEGQKPLPRPAEEEARSEPPARQEPPPRREPPPPHHLPPPHHHPPPPGGMPPPPGRRRP